MRAAAADWGLEMSTSNDIQVNSLELFTYRSNVKR